MMDREKKIDVACPLTKFMIILRAYITYSTFAFECEVPLANAMGHSMKKRSIDDMVFSGTRD